MKNILYQELKLLIENAIKTETVPIHTFEDCINMMYVLSSNNSVISDENTKKEISDAQDQIYGLLMDFG